MSEIDIQRAKKLARDKFGDPKHGPMQLVRDAFVEGYTERLNQESGVGNLHQTDLIERLKRQWDEHGRVNYLTLGSILIDLGVIEDLMIAIDDSCDECGYPSLTAVTTRDMRLIRTVCGSCQAVYLPESVV